MPAPNLALAVVGVLTALAVSACGSFAAFNRPLAEPGSGAPLAQTRARLAVDGKRGNPKVLMFLALSGGGSRAAYLSGAAMLQMQTVFDDIDLLREVDVLSSVSGGSLAAAFYALTRDEVLASETAWRALQPAGDGAPALAKLRFDADGKGVRCDAPLDDEERARVAAALAPRARLAAEVADLCRQAALTRLRGWDETSVKRGMSRDYLWRWIGNWFWPSNVLRYWFTAFDRTDIMAQTLADNLFDSPVIGEDATFADLNPTRPYLIVNATSATQKVVGGHPVPQEYAFGTVFTFTDEEFEARLASDLAGFKVANAVMASSAFPLVFPLMTLQDFRPNRHPLCRPPAQPPSDLCRRHFLHLFDGGNSDNLGLSSVKRVLMQMAVDRQLDGYEQVVVFLVDAFTLPQGARRTRADPRNPLSFFLDTNVSDAVDALLQANRSNLIYEFRNARLAVRDSDCTDETRAWPKGLCERIASSPPEALAKLNDKLFFYHFGFEDVRAIDLALKARLDEIPTSFRISDRDARLLDDVVRVVLSRDNECLRQMAALLRGDETSVAKASAKCREADAVPTQRSSAPAGPAPQAATSR